MINYLIFRIKRKLKLILFNNRIEKVNSELEYPDVKLNIWGYINYVFGISTTTRDFIYLLSLSFNNFVLIPLQIPSKSKVNNFKPEDLGKLSYPQIKANNNLLFVNADSMADFLHKNRKYLVNKYNIAVYWWEFPSHFYFKGMFDLINEVLVFSTVTFKAIEQIKPNHVKLTKLTYPFILKVPNNTISQCKDQFQINSEDFIIMYVFDIHSSIERKNPYGIIDTFEKVSKEIHNAKLVLKITNFELWRKECLELQEYINNISISNKCRIISDNLSDDDMRSLINCCDIYLSLHRAEGFGITMLEAMSMSKVVIATKFGGNLDFMEHEKNSILIDYSDVEVKRDFGPYKKGWIWADPDIHQAANAIIKLANDNNYYKKIASQAYLDVWKQYDSIKLRDEYTNYVISKVSY